ncbi:hypothetical protein NOD94_040425, partial [Streptomyces sp. Isolate_45]|nr:hypothetical protein [Streptomyces sp. Isolate_45]
PGAARRRPGPAHAAVTARPRPGLSHVASACPAVPFRRAVPFRPAVPFRRAVPFRPAVPFRTAGPEPRTGLTSGPGTTARIHHRTAEETHP